MNATLVLLITLNMVLIQENGVKREIPSQLMYSKYEPIMYLLLPDTVETYTIEQIDVYRRVVIVRVSSTECRGFVRIYTNAVKRRGIDMDVGAVYFFKYCGSDPVDRLFTVDPDLCYSLVKKLDDRKKKECRKKNKTP